MDFADLMPATTVDYVFGCKQHIAYLANRNKCAIQEEDRDRLCCFSRLQEKCMIFMLDFAVFLLQKVRRDLKPDRRLE